MFSKLFSAFIVAVFLLSSLVEGLGAQVDLTSVGPSTPLSSKSKICNILNYGGVADNATDIGPAISKAFTSCASTGGATILIPPGTYSLKTGVTLNKGRAFALQIDGLIILTSDGSFGGNAFVIGNGNDVEVFSGNGLGAINGQGYIARKTKSGQNARLFRFISCTDISIHDIILVDSPTFHLVFDGVSNMEAYHITVRGPNEGGTDGVDVSCIDNCYLHDIEVTNRDECCSVKSPSNNMLIENFRCNQSGGMSIGSLNADGVTSVADEAQVSNITMRDISIFQCTQMLMIKTFPGGDGKVGYVKDSIFENFWAYDTTYGLDIDQYWQETTTPDTGAVALSGLTFNNWTGTVDNGVSRAPFVIRGSDIVPLTDITLSNFDMWTVNENKLYDQCKNVYGTGYCVATSTPGQALTTFTTTLTVTAPPAAYTPPISPAWGLDPTGYGLTIPIPVYTPAVFWSLASPNDVSGTPLSTNAGASISSSSVPAPTTKASTKSTVKSAVATSTVKASTSLKKSSVVASSTSAGTKVSSSLSVVKATSATSVAVVSSSSVKASKTTKASTSTKESTSIKHWTRVKASKTIKPSTSLAPVVKSPISLIVTPSSTLVTSTKPAVTSSSSSSSAPASSSATGGTIDMWGQCGGQDWTGSGSCVAGSTCVVQNPWYYQCLKEEEDTCE